jgi:hypothetical protein
VLLLNRTPLALAAADAVRVSGGRISVRAAEGVRPVLEVEVTRGTPFLATTAESPLALEGVTIVARYVGPAGTDPTPVIAAGGDVALSRCAFRVEPRVPGSCALAQEGGTLRAAGCSFENFDRALDLAFFGDTTSRVQHCLFVRGRTEGSADPGTDKPDASASGGWAVRLRWMPGASKKDGRRVALTNCTAQGRGLLDFVGFSPHAPIRVDVTSCAVLADALVSWEAAAGGNPAPPARAALSWRGEGNQYDIRGPSWLRLRPPGGGPSEPISGGPADAGAWTEAVGPEHALIPPPVRFATDPSSLPDRPTPGAFAVATLGAAKPVGADPAYVGPGSQPAPRADAP